MAGLFVVLLVSPMVVAVIAFLLFRYVALSRGSRPLIAVGSLWIGGSALALVFWLIRVRRTAR